MSAEPSVSRPAPARGTPVPSGSIIVGIFIVVSLAVGGAALAYLKLTPHPVAIGAVLADLRKYDGQTVLMQGTVQSAVNLVGFKTFELKDDTGSILVVTQRGLPPEGQFQRVTGTVNQVFQIGPATYTVLLEGPAATAAGGK